MAVYGPELGLTVVAIGGHKRYRRLAVGLPQRRHDRVGEDRGRLADAIHTTSPAFEGNLTAKHLQSQAIFGPLVGTLQVIKKT